MKLGAYAHISISVRNLRESAAFYNALGFKRLFADSLPRPWELLTDGCINLHLYESYFVSPALHYFSSKMEETIVHLKRIGITPELQRSKDGKRQQHNFSDPNDVTIMLMHHDDASMPRPDGTSHSILGTFGELSIPADNIKMSGLFWDKIGFRQKMKSNKPYSWSAMSDDVISIALHQTGTFSTPALTYYAEDIKNRLLLLRERNIPITHELKNHEENIEGAILTAPEGQLIFLLQESPNLEAV